MAAVARRIDLKLSTFLAGAILSLTAFAEMKTWSQGDGSAQNPYRISSVKDLQLMATYTSRSNSLQNVHFKLMADLDLSEVCGPEKGNWVPIGGHLNPNESTHPLKVATAFMGTFDGGGHTISNLYYNSEANGNVGLFGNVYSAIIRDLRVTGSVTAGKWVGGIIGASHGASLLSRLYNEVKVHAFHCAGGICGAAGVNPVPGQISHFEGCTNVADVVVEIPYPYADYEEGNAYAGGVCGAIGTGAMVDCENRGTVTANGNYVGGVTGAANVNRRTTEQQGGEYISINHCRNVAQINQTPYIPSNPDYGGGHGVGGIVGCGSYTNNFQWCEISACVNEGRVVTTSSAEPRSSRNVCAGGICGLAAIVNRCINKGDVTAYYKSVGGIAGQYAVILNSANYGKVQGWDCTGGLIGFNDPSSRGFVNNCFNAGQIENTAASCNEVGTLGGHYCMSINNSYARKIINTPYIDAVTVNLLGNAYCWAHEGSFIHDSLYGFGQNNEQVTPSSNWSGAGTQYTVFNGAAPGNILNYQQKGFPCSLTDALNTYVGTVQAITFGDRTYPLLTWTVITGVNEGYPVFAVPDLSGGAVTYDMGVVSAAAPARQTGVNVTAAESPTQMIVQDGVKYSFDSWNTAADGSGLRVAAGANFHTEGKANVLYAQWIRGYQVRYVLSNLFNPDDFTLQESSLIYPIDPIWHDGTDAQATVQSPSVYPAEFVDPKATFAYWATKEDGTGLRYFPGESFIPTRDMTLYAVPVDVVSLWIADHEDAGAERIHLAFSPTFNVPNVSEDVFRQWTQTAAERKRICVLDSSISVLVPAPLRGDGLKDLAKRWIWISSDIGEIDNQALSKRRIVITTERY